MNTESQDFKDGYKMAMEQMLRTQLQANQARKETVRPSAPKPNENSAEATGHFNDPSFINQVYDERAAMVAAANKKGATHGN